MRTMTPPIPDLRAPGTVMAVPSAKDKAINTARQMIQEPHGQYFPSDIQNLAVQYLRELGLRSIY